MITYNKILVCLDQSEVDRAVIQNSCEIAKVAGTTEVTFLNIIKDFNLSEPLMKEFPDLVEKAIKNRMADLEKFVEAYFDCAHVKKNLVIKQGTETKEILAASVEYESDLIILGRKKESNSVLNTRIIRRAACNILVTPEDTMLAFDNIHVPVDFSAYSLLSLETALTFTKNINANILLQNVFNVHSSYRYSGKTFEEFARIMEENSDKELQVLVRQAHVSDQNLDTIHTLDNGQNTIQVIFDESSKRNMNLIVMGAKGRTAASSLFIGSKAERMIQINDTIPLLVVREKGANAGILESLKDL
jgi:nucleotide-binding universal stress UspA family protein